jgi:non-ribosomal peptide synthetase component F
VTSVELLRDLRRRGFKMWVDGENLRVQAPASAADVEIKARIAALKSEIIAHLKAEAIGRHATVAHPPTSYAQERLWFVDQLEPGSTAFNPLYAMRVLGELNEAALLLAFDAVVARHGSLRTTFEVVEDRPWQRVHEPRGGVVKVEDASTWDDFTIRQRAQKEMETPFDLQRGPLFRATLLRRLAEPVLLVMAHHIVVDGWSFDILWRELRLLYEAFRKGERVSLPELHVQYTDFAIWQRRYLSDERLEYEVGFWKKFLDGAPVALELPTDHPRPPVEGHRGARVGFELGKTQVEALRKLGEKYEATLFMVLLASYGVLLGRHANQRDVVVGTPVANRMRAEIEPLIGFFVNTLALRVRFEDDVTFGELVGQVKRRCVDAFEHQDLPFQKLVEALNPVRDRSRSPRCQAMFVLQNTPQTAVTKGALTLEPIVLAERQTTTSDMKLTVWETERGADALLDYSTDVFDGSTVERLARHWQVLLEAACRNDGLHCAELPLVAEVERQALLVEWNDTSANCLMEECVHQLFEGQVDRSPDAVAVVLEESQLTYRQLDRRANQLSHQLRELGVGPDVVVAICVERSIEMVLGILGILKAGGAYVPLDPEYPEDRLAFMLEDARVRIMLTQGRHKSRVSSYRAKALHLDANGEVTARHAGTRLSRVVTPRHLAYVIYTSGSTGKPKAVSVEHQSVSHYVLEWGRHFPLPADGRALQSASLSFDVSIRELFWPLASGAALVLAAPHAERDPATLLTMVAASRVSTVRFVPTVGEARVHGGRGLIRAGRHGYARERPLRIDQYLRSD